MSLQTSISNRRLIMDVMVTSDEYYDDNNLATAMR